MIFLVFFLVNILLVLLCAETSSSCLVLGSTVSCPFIITCTGLLPCFVLLLKPCQLLLLSSIFLFIYIFLASPLIFFYFIFFSFLLCFIPDLLTLSSLYLIETSRSGNFHHFPNPSSYLISTTPFLCIWNGFPLCLLVEFICPIFGVPKMYFKDWWIPNSGLFEINR